MAAPRPPTRPGQSAKAYPLKWIEETFSSKERTESLLRPEVENGNVTYHDMELAQSFFSSKKRYLPLLYSNLAFLGTAAYSLKFARPKWSLTKLVTISTFLGIGSYTFGFNQKLSAHFRFARSLENPTGFNQALRNINARLGGPEHFPYGVPELREESIAVALGPGVTALSNDKKPRLETTESGEDWSFPPSQEEPDQNQSPTDAKAGGKMFRALTLFASPSTSTFDLTKFSAQQTSQPNAQRPPSKWDEIRAANNKSGSPSSWDLIRQNHERNKMSLSQSQSSAHSRNPAGRADGTEASNSSIATDKNEKQWENRAFDESQFEAVLEAERRRASRA